MRRFFAGLAIAAALLLSASPAAVRAQSSTQTTFSRESPAEFLARMRSLAADGHIEAAISEAGDYSRNHPEATDVRRMLGDLYYRKPDLASAEQIYKSIVARDPADRETWNRLGGIYAAQDRVDDAIKAFERSLPEASGFANLVELHRRRGDLAPFEQATANEAIQHPLDLRALGNYGNILRAMRKYPEALAVFTKAYELEPNRCAQLNDLANAQLDLGRINDAVPHLKRCLELDSSNYVALVNSGEANIELGRFDRARPFLDQAVRVRPDRPEALVDIGYLEDVAQRWKSAVDSYQRAIAADPLSIYAYVNLGYDYNEQRLFALAEAAFIKGLSVSPRDGRLQYLLGVTYNEQGKVALARQQYERAMTSDEELVVRAAKRELAQLPPAPAATR